MRRAAPLGAFLFLTACSSKPPSSEGAAEPRPEAVEVTRAEARKLGPQPLTILATASLEGELSPCGCASGPLGGVGRWVTEHDRLKRAASGRLLAVDAGDLLFARPVFSRAERPAAESKARWIAQRREQDSLAAVAVGELDLALGLMELRALDLPLLAANLVHTKSGTAAFAASRIVELGDTRVGFVGVSAVRVNGRFHPAYAAAKLRVTPAGPALARAVADLKRQRPDVIVALVHAELPLVERALKQVDEGAVDLVVLGHDRRLGTDRIAGVPVLRPGHRGQWIGRADFAVSGSALAEPELSLIELGEAIEPAAAVVAAANAQMSPRVEGRGSSLRFLGSKACRKCHAPAYRQWKATPHAHAYETLSRARQGANLDCLPCHTTGFDRTGGPRVLAELAGLVHVGCESCHGPGSAHAEAPKTTRTPPVTQAVCVDCHRPQADQKPFNFARRLRKVLGRGHGGGK